jgi:hypothetical protein
MTTTTLAAEVWYSVEDTAVLCKRRPQTIFNLVSKHQLPRRLGWKVKNRLRKRVMYLSPTTVDWLQRITLFGEDPHRLQKPSR